MLGERNIPVAVEVPIRKTPLLNVFAFERESDVGLKHVSGEGAGKISCKTQLQQRIVRDDQSACTLVDRH